MNNKILVLLFFSLVISSQLFSQCKMKNTFFKEGETLIYDMNFKLGLINTHAGTLSLTVDKDKVEGMDCYKLVFQTNTSGVANTIFMVRDTLTSYMTKDLVPVAYIKNALEGDNYTQERLKYSYLGDGKVKIQTKRSKNGEFRFDETVTSDQCLYDLVSVIYYARTIDFSKKSKGDKVTIGFISGKDVSTADIVLNGTKKVKASNKNTYECYELDLHFVAGGGSAKSKSSMKVLLSKDDNRIPVQIESSLKKIGSVKGNLKSAEGLRN